MKQKKEIAAVHHLLDTGKAREAEMAFQKLEPEGNIEYLLLKGKIEQKFQHWGEAMNAYNKVLEMDPGHDEAKNNLHLIKNILNFWNPDMFNP